MPPIWVYSATGLSKLYAEFWSCRLVDRMYHCRGNAEEKVATFEECCAKGCTYIGKCTHTNAYHPSMYAEFDDYNDMTITVFKDGKQSILELSYVDMDADMMSIS